MRSVLLSVALFVGVSYAANSVDFLVLPDSVTDGASRPDSIPSSTLPSLAASLLGLNSKHLPGLSQDLFSKPEAVVVIQVESAHKLDIVPSSHALKVDMDGAPDYSDLFFDLTTNYPDGGVTAVESAEEISGSFDGEIVSETALDNKVEPDLLVEKELNNANSLMKWVNKNAGNLVNSKPDVFLVHFNGMDGPEDANAAAHKTSISTFIQDFSAAMKTAYGKNAAILLVQLDPIAHSRQPRKSASVEAAATTPKPPSVKSFSARWYDNNYPVAFNIILWFMVAFWLTILGVSVFIWFMDPGSDSIIYRMTMTKGGKRD